MPASLTCEQVEFLLEINDPNLWENPGAAWDISHWDAVDSTWVQAEGAGWMDATEYNRGFTIDRGRQSDWDDFLVGVLNFELDNTTGVFSLYGTMQFPRIRPGAGVAIYGWWNSVRYPLFRGTIAEWNESHTPDDYTIKAVAQDEFRKLAEPIDVEYHAGEDHESIADRINGLLDRVGVKGPRYIQPGTVTLTNYSTSRTILDEIKVSAMSDCGSFFVDNDGTITYLNRDRFFGRPSTTSIPIFGDGCNTLEMPYAAVDPVIADNEFGNIVIVRNVSQGADSPGVAQAVSQNSINAYGRYLWSPTQLVIANVEWLQGIADWQLKRRSILYYRIDSFECYPIHDDRLWPTLLNMRLGTLIKVIRRPPQSTPINANMVVDGMRIEATPSLWKFMLRCSPGTIVDDVPFWDVNAYWDVTKWL